MTFLLGITNATVALVCAGAFLAKPTVLWLLGVVLALSVFLYCLRGMT